MVKVFVTGGTGFVGSRLIRPSRTTGLELDKLNVNIIQGPVTDLDIIASAAAGSEAVTHMAFGHQETIEQDIAVIQTIKKALQSSGKLFGNDTGLHAAVIRLPPFVYARGFSFFYNVIYKAAEKDGSASYIGAGDNKTCAVHADDAARAYVALLTHTSARGVYIVVGEKGVTSKHLAEIIASKLHCD